MWESLGDKSGLLYWSVLFLLACK